MADLEARLAQAERERDEFLRRAEHWQERADQNHDLADTLQARLATAEGLLREVRDFQTRPTTEANEQAADDLQARIDTHLGANK